MTTQHGRKIVALLTLAGALALPPAATADLSLRDARQVAAARMQKMERELKDEGARDSGVRGCWRERRAIGCLGMVSGKDSLLRWRCAVPMTLRKRPAASASSRRVAVRFTDPMCSF